MTRLLARLPRPAARPASPFGPDAIEVGPRALRVGDGWCASFAIVGYPREVGHGWLEPLTAHPGRLDVALHVEPVPAAVAADRLRRQLARLESGRRADAAKGRLGDPDVEVAAEDARELAAGLARGEQKLFRVGLYLTVHAASEKALDAECARVRAVCASMLLDAQPATWRTLQGWTSTLPVGVDALGQRRSFDTDALAASFPFASAELSATTRRPLRHRHQRVGAGAVGPLRPGQPQLGHPRPLRGRQVLPGQARSTALALRRDRGRRRRPRRRVPPAGRDRRRRLRPPRGARGAGQPLRPAPGPDALTRRALFVHTLVAVLLGGKPDPAATAALDRGIVAAYESVGITADPRSHARPAPLLADLASALDADGDPAARTLAARLAPFVTGTHRGLFDGPTTTRPDGHLIVFSPPRPARRAEGGRDAAHPGRHLAAGVRPDQPQTPAGDRRRGVAAHVRAVRRRVLLPHGQVGPQALGRAHRRHPRRRRPARLAARPGGRGQRRHPDPAAPSPPVHRHPGRGLRSLGRRAGLPPRRGAAARACSPPASTGWPSPRWPAPTRTTSAAPGSSRPSTTPPTSRHRAQT